MSRECSQEQFGMGFMILLLAIFGEQLVPQQL